MKRVDKSIVLEEEGKVVMWRNNVRKSLLLMAFVLGLAGFGSAQVDSLNTVESLGLGDAISEDVAAKEYVAVMDLEVTYGVEAALARPLSDRLRQELHQTDAFRVVERNAMETILEEQSLQLSGCTSDECAIEVGRLLGVSKMVAGSFAKIGDTFTINLRMIDVETGAYDEAVSADCACTIDDVLTTQLRYVASRLAGLDVEEPTYSVRLADVPNDTSSVDSSIVDTTAAEPVVVLADTTEGRTTQTDEWGSDDWQEEKRQSLQSRFKDESELKPELKPVETETAYGWKEEETPRSSRSRRQSNSFKDSKNGFKIAMMGGGASYSFDREELVIPFDGIEFTDDFSSDGVVGWQAGGRMGYRFLDFLQLNVCYSYMEFVPKKREFRQNTPFKMSSGDGDLEVRYWAVNQSYGFEGHVYLGGLYFIYGIMQNELTVNSRVALKEGEENPIFPSNFDGQRSFIDQGRSIGGGIRFDDHAFFEVKRKTFNGITAVVGDFILAF